MPLLLLNIKIEKIEKANKRTPFICTLYAWLICMLFLFLSSFLLFFIFVHFYLKLDFFTLSKQLLNNTEQDKNSKNRLLTFSHGKNERKTRLGWPRFCQWIIQSLCASTTMSDEQRAQIQISKYARKTEKILHSSRRHHYIVDSYLWRGGRYCRQRQRRIKKASTSANLFPQSNQLWWFVRAKQHCHQQDLERTKRHSARVPMDG